MDEIPLFPLNTVLFPGVPLKLHIFEERYRRMIRLCLDTNQPFGVVLIRRGFEALGPLAQPHPIGCTAQIVDMQPLADGRMFITVIGMERFRILSLDEALPYLVGRVVRCPVERVDPQACGHAGERLRRHMERYFRVLSEHGKGHYDLQNLPEDPVQLAYLGAALVSLAANQKQEFLALDQGLALVEAVRKVFFREEALLKILLSERSEEKGAFSVN